MRRRATALTTAVAVVATLAGACADNDNKSAQPTEVSYGAHIDLNTPQGLRAKQTMDMLNSNWPIGPVGVRTLAAPDKVDAVVDQLDPIWWDRPFKVSAIDINAGQATLHVLNKFNVAQDIELHTDDSGQVDRLEVSLRPPVINKWSDIDAEIKKTGARYSYQATKVVGGVPGGPPGKCVNVAGTNTDMSLPLASIFKLYVLLAVAETIKAGKASWDDQLTITKEGKAVGSAGLDKRPPGSHVSVRELAQQMISASDNMATDMLIGHVGTHAVEQALVAGGHHDPASMTPFPTMHEVFSVGWGRPDLREQWKQAATPQARTQLLKQTDGHPYDPDPTRSRWPASKFGLEWFGSASDICRVHAALQAIAVGPAAPVKDILSALPGIDLDQTKWHYIGAKGGNLPGDLTFSWYAVDYTGQPWVVSFQLNWPEYRSPTAAGWLLSIAKRAFALVPLPRPS